MNFAKKIDYAQRLTAQKEARAALVAKMKPKPAASTSDLAEREARKEAERQAVRAKRLEEREAARLAREQAAAEAAEAVRLAELAAQEAKRNERKERKTNMKLDSQARRAAKLEAYAKFAGGGSDAR